MDNQSKTTCSLLTPLGRGAVAVVALSGVVEEILDFNFQPANGKAYSAGPRRKIVYGVWNSTGEDLIIYRRSTQSNQRIEIHCHGGSMASKAIIDDLKSAGVEQIPAEDFLKNAGIGSAASHWKAEILIALSKAKTKRTAEILLDQLTVGPKQIDAIVAQIQAFQFESALKQIESIQSWSQYGTHLTEPRIIVFCGQPNVGKSSLVNAIVGFQRAIVNEVAGTTRDVVSQSTAISGWPVELRDTAGLRESENAIETIGIEKAHAEIANADLKICVFDISRKWDTDDQRLVDSICPDLIVFNKSDLTKESQSQCPIEFADSIVTSVESGTGIETLIQQIGTHLSSRLPESRQAIPVSAQQITRLYESATILKNSLKQDQQTDSANQSICAQALDCLFLTAGDEL